MAEGALAQEQLNKAARNGDINSTQYNQLTNKLSSQGLGVTDFWIYNLNIQNSIIGGSRYAG